MFRACVYFMDSVMVSKIVKCTHMCMYIVLVSNHPRRPMDSELWMHVAKCQIFTIIT